MNKYTPDQQEYNGVGTPLLNLAPLNYEDSFSTPANRPQNPRLISNLLSHQEYDEFLPESRGLSNMVWAFGQFIDHDLSLTPEISFPPNSSPDTSLYIPVPRGDSWLDPQNIGTVLIPIHDSDYIEGTGTNPDNPRQLPNEITGWLDLSSVYGSDSERNKALRSFVGGRLKVSKEDLLPFNYDLLPNDNPTRKDPRTLFLAGDVRANENTALLALHSLFVREHNRLAEKLAQKNPDWDDETLYQRARKRNIAQYQAIIYQEYLPALFGEDSIPEYQGYDSGVNPSITRTFSTAAFRFGHTMLSSEIPLISIEGNQEESLQLAELFFNSAELLPKIGIDSLLRGLSYSSSQELDNKLINDVRNLLFGFGEKALGRDLAALNIQRGRINGLADYNTIRQAHGLTAVESFAEITSNVELQNKLATIYATVEEIDPWVGFLAEDHLPNMSMGESLYTIILDQFQRLRQGDRFYYENIFLNKDLKLDRISDTTLGDLILRNTDTKTMAESVFFIPEMTYVGTDGDDTFWGTPNQNTFYCSLGNDIMIGSEGKDTLNYENLELTIDFDLSGEITKGEEYFDVVKNIDSVIAPSHQPNSITASSLTEEESIMVNLAKNLMEIKDDNGKSNHLSITNFVNVKGTSQKDSIIGDDQDNILTGGGGNDSLRGNGGKDTFDLADDYQEYGNHDHAMIRDFSITDGDMIKLAGTQEDYVIKSKRRFTMIGTRKDDNRSHHSFGKIEDLVAIVIHADHFKPSMENFIFTGET